MKTATILALAFFAMGAASQDVVQSPTHAQCTFSDGTSIAFSYLLQHQRYRLSTNGPLLTTQGTSVPAGDYSVYLEKDSHQHWTLKMMKPFGGSGRKGISRYINYQNGSFCVKALPRSSIMYFQISANTFRNLKPTRKGTA